MTIPQSPITFRRATPAAWTVLPPTTQQNELVPLKKEEISVKDTYVVTICRGYEQYCLNQNLISLPSCTHALEQLKTYYRLLYERDTKEAEEFKPWLDYLTSCVQEMNMRSPTLTRQDLNGIATFLTKPIEEYYIDNLTGDKYLQPDHSQLLKFGGRFYIAGEYKSIGLLREKTVNGKLCDILYLTKQEDQVAYEGRTQNSHSNSYSSSTFSNSIMGVFSYDELIKTRITKQKGLLETHLQSLQKLFKEWKYESYQPCSAEELRALKFPEEGVRQNHAIIFYYKKADGA